ncbi:hypothetical protein ACE2AJ_00550 [Aquihabitans daechungensis]|uniref:hypothetical protein n=1 Tax=Aquihabitans daechungensis TaxID=1052257 RepID=UPI003BA1C034
MVGVAGREATTMRWTKLLVLAFASLLFFGAGPPAFGADPTIYVSDKDVEVSADGTDVQITALSSAPDDLALSAEVPGQPECDVAVSPKKLVSERLRSVRLTLSGDCDVEKGAKLALTGTGGASPITVDVVAAKAAVTPEYWDDLKDGAWQGPLVALVVVALAWIFAMQKQFRSVRTALPGLDKTWSFSDSWIANVTAISTAIVAVLFGSDSLESILGEKPTHALATLTAAAGLAALLVALSGMVTGALVAGERQNKGAERGMLTAGGVALGALLTLSGTFIAVFTVIGMAGDVFEDIPDVAIVAASIAVVGIVAWYGFWTLKELIDVNKIEPKATPDATVTQLKRIAKALGSPEKPTRKPRPRAGVVPEGRPAEIDDPGDGEDVDGFEAQPRRTRRAGML